CLLLWTLRDELQKQPPKRLTESGRLTSIRALFKGMAVGGHLDAALLLKLWHSTVRDGASKTGRSANPIRAGDTVSYRGRWRLAGYCLTDGVRDGCRRLTSLSATRGCRRSRATRCRLCRPAHRSEAFAPASTPRHR